VLIELYPVVLAFIYVAVLVFALLLEYSTQDSPRLYKCPKAFQNRKLSSSFTAVSIFGHFVNLYFMIDGLGYENIIFMFYCGIKSILFLPIYFGCDNNFPCLVKNNDHIYYREKTFYRIKDFRFENRTANPSEVVRLFVSWFKS